jgi:hypothetical protein
MFRCWLSEKSVAKQAGVVNNSDGAPHHDKTFKHEGHRSIRLILVNGVIWRRSEKADQKALDEGDHNQKGSRAVESRALPSPSRVSHFSSLISTSMTST